MPRLSPGIAAPLLAITVAVAGGCATNPVTGGKDVVLMSESQEIEIGRKAHPQVLQQYGRYEDEALQQYVNGVGQRIAAVSHRPELQYTFTVLDSADVNAFALPGGFVYITRGIMAYLNSEAELAAVLGHEIGHVTARHAVRQQTGATAAGVGAAVVGILTGSGDLANVAGAAGTAPDSVSGVRPAVKRIGTFWREALMRPFSAFAVPTPTCTIMACGFPVTIA